MNNEKIDLPLRDIHLPESVSSMPWVLYLTIFIVAVAFLILAFFAIRKLTRWILRPTLKKQAKAILQDIEENFQNTENAAKCMADLSAFLRRLALSKSENNAGLTGAAWLQLLDKPLNSNEFSQGVGKLLLTSPYQRNVDKFQVSELLKLTSRWVNTL